MEIGSYDNFSRHTWQPVWETLLEIGLHAENNLALWKLLSDTA